MLAGRALTARPHTLFGPTTLDSPFTIDAEARDDALVIRITGPFDLAAVADVENRVDVALDSRLPSIVFDLRRVTFLDMAALGSILRANARARTASKAVRVVPPCGLAKRVFTLTRVGDHLIVVKDDPSAESI